MRCILAIVGLLVCCSIASTEYKITDRWPGCLPAIQDQGYCGSCYAFATAYAMTSRFCIQRGRAVSSYFWSPQKIVSCGGPGNTLPWSGTTGCEGGYIGRTLSWTGTNVMPTCSDTSSCTTGCLPYTCYRYDQNPSCASAVCSTCANGGSYSSYYQIYSVLQVLYQSGISTQLLLYGPVVAGFNVCNSFYTFFDSHPTGVYTTACYTSSSDFLGGHAVAIVGEGTADDGTSYWIVANSWSTDWGDNGFFRIKKGICGIESGAYSAMFLSGREAESFGNYTVLEEQKNVEDNTTDTLAVAGGVSVAGPVAATAAATSILVSVNLANVAINRMAAEGTERVAPPARLLSVDEALVQVVSGKIWKMRMTVENEDGSTSQYDVAATESVSGEFSVASVATVSTAAAGLSAAAIAGIVIGSVAGAAVVGGGSVAVYKKMKANEDSSSSSAPTDTELGPTTEPEVENPEKRKFSIKETLFGKMSRPKVDGGVDIFNPKNKKSITARDGTGVRL